MNLLKYDMKQAALKGLTNDETIKHYKEHINRFAEWAKTAYHIRLQRDIVRHPEVDTPEKLVQKYEEYLKHGYKKDLSAATIHTYLAPVCRAFGIPMEKIQKPRRNALSITKCRNTKKNQRGQKEAQDPKNTRLVQLASVIALRRREYGKMPAIALKKDVCGHVCIEIRGKGGKVQRQRILDRDVPLVRAAFAEKEGKQKIFDKAELKNHISLHSLRAAHARECYQYYRKICQSGGREQLKKELLQYFDAYHVGDPKSRRFQKQRETFLAGMERGNGRYKLRGENVVRAKMLGRSLEYDRVALLCVSVFHLAHWRNDVTVRHYML